MPNDATLEIMAEIQNQEAAAISLIGPTTYNIDDMDPRPCMISLIFTGCYCLSASKAIDPKRPGMIYIDGAPAESPLVPPVMPSFGQLIGIHCRRWLKEYGRTYQIRYAGACDTEGVPIPEFTFELRTLERSEPGEAYPEHDALVLQAAREGAVLLKNENQTLPLGEGSTVNPFGAAAAVFRCGCLGAGKINPRYSIRVKEGIEKYTSLRLNEELYDFYMQERDVLPDEEMLARAQALSDTAVVFLSRCSSEAHDALPQKGQYYLTDEERSLLAGVSKRFARTAVVLNTAYPIETGWIDELGIDAVLWTGLSGMAGGRALAELLEGSVSPSGKLPNTWALDYKDYPSAVNFHSIPDVWEKSESQEIRFLTTAYEEGIYVGYRYFDTFGKKAAYLFGHGLSYTTFARDVIRMECADASARLEVNITNTGVVAGKEVVQLYACIPDGRLEQPRARLAAFAKTKLLAPGESELLTLEVAKSRLKSYDEEHARWIIEAGTIGLLLGGAPDAAEPVGEIVVSEEIVIAETKNRLTCPVELRELSKRDSDGTYPKGSLTKAFSEEKLPYSVPAERVDAGEELKGQDRLITFPEVQENPALAESFVTQMSDYELARLCVCGRTGWGAEDSGFAGKLFNDGELEKYRIPDYYFADGNNGCNMFRPNIGFPVSTTMCASWNEELMYAEGKAIAKEAADMELDCILAPALNLQRNPLCGRHTEYFSEDPLLAGRMAGQQSRGFEENGVASCMKHFFANNAETMRNQNHSLMSERAARELYIGAFEAAFEVHMPDTVMTGYNAANGLYSSDNPKLLRGILRGELGFTGYVMTDWGGYGDQGMPALLNAGISWIAPGSMDDSLVTPIVSAIESGELRRAVVQQNVLDLVHVIAKKK